MIVFACGACRQRLQVSDDQAGAAYTCPHCSRTIRIPKTAAPPAATGVQRSPLATQIRSAGEVSLSAKESVSGVDADTGSGTSLSGEATGTWAGAPAARAAWKFLAPARRADEIGRLGSFRVLAVLGVGGMGVVFRAEDTELNRPVALKAMLPALAASDAARQRFLREAQAAAAVVHDHVVRILQVGEDRGVPFLAMQLLQGEALAARLQRPPPLTVAEAVRIGRETALGLAAAHRRGLIHRDIKPANLWLEARPGEAPRIKVLDFGLARAGTAGSDGADGPNDAPLTQSGAIVGTPAYMAPEQAAGEPVDARTDLFALGCVLYRMLTGAAPFRGKDAIATLVAVATEEPPPPHAVCPDVPAGLSDLVMRLLAKDPRDRPASAEAVAKILGTFDSPAAGSAVPRLPARPRPAHAQRGRFPWVLAVGVLGIVACGIFACGLLLALLVWRDGRLVQWLTKEAAPLDRPANPVPVVNKAPVPPPPVHVVGKDGLTLTGALAASEPCQISYPHNGQEHAMPAKQYLVRLAAGKRYRMAMDSTDFDTFLLVEDEQGQQRAADDDSGGNLNALLTYEPAKDGIYRVHAASFEGKGNFTLRVHEVVAVAVHDVGPNGLTIRDVLSAKDPLLAKFRLGKKIEPMPTKEFRVRLHAGKKYRIALDSDVVDTYLAVRSPAGHQVAWDDDSGGNENSLLELDVFTDGVYTIQAAAYRRLGGFTLQVEEAGVPQLREVGTGLALTHSLEDEDTFTLNVRLEAGKTYVLDLCSPDLEKLDPFLQLLAEDGKLLAEDHGGGANGNARIRYRVAQTGIYRIVATDYQFPEGGEVALAVRVDAAPEPGAVSKSWVVQDGELRQTAPAGPRWLCFGDPNWSDYDFEVEALAVAGSELDIGFRATSPNNLAYAALGGYANTHHGLMQRLEAKPGAATTLTWAEGKTQPDRWYRVRIEARGSAAKVYLDGKLVLTAASLKIERGGVAVGTVDARARFRNPKVTTPDGKVLLERWPSDLPEAKAQSRRPLTPGRDAALLYPRARIQTAPAWVQPRLEAPVRGWSTRSLGARPRRGMAAV